MSIQSLAATPAQYSSTAEVLCDRIFKLIPDQPQIMELNDAWGLFKVPGFKCDDLGPSLGQAMGALGKAQYRWNSGERP